MGLGREGTEVLMGVLTTPQQTLSPVIIQEFVTWLNVTSETEAVWNNRPSSLISCNQQVSVSHAHESKPQWVFVNL